MSESGWARGSEDVAEGGEFLVVSTTAMTISVEGTRWAGMLSRHLVVVAVGGGVKGGIVIVIATEMIRLSISHPGFSVYIHHLRLLHSTLYVRPSLLAYMRHIPI